MKNTVVVVLLLPHYPQDVPDPWHIGLALVQGEASPQKARADSSPDTQHLNSGFQMFRVWETLRYRECQIPFCETIICLQIEGETTCL